MKVMRNILILVSISSALSACSGEEKVTERSGQAEGYTKQEIEKMKDTRERHFGRGRNDE